VVGIDVGGPRKGFHAVALRDGGYLDKFASPDAPARSPDLRDFNVTLGQ
jgi:hypothetical protein